MNRTEEARAQTLVELEQLHAEVSRDAARLEQVHAARLRCARGCASCCVDELTVYEVEAERIRRRHGELLRSASPHSLGACAFLDAGGACRVYAERPYVCRTQGLPLRWTEERAPGEGVELRDICPLNEDGPAVEELPAAQCWTLGPIEARLAELQRRWGGGTMRRVALRDLFEGETRDDG